MWKYKNKQINKTEDFPESDLFGFIYRIINKKTGQFYIGKKQILSKVNKKLGKKAILALPIQRGRKVTKRLVVSESNWLNYWGSCKPLLEEVKVLGEDKFEREILMFCKTKKQLNFYEVYFQIKEDVLFKNSFNETILGKYFRRDFL